MRTPGEATSVAAEGAGPRRAAVTPGSFIHVYLGLAVGLCVGALAVLWRRLLGVDGRADRSGGGPRDGEA